MNLGLHSKRIMVTGGNSGIGKSIVMRFIEEGARVVINYHSHPEFAKSLVSAIGEKGGTAIAIEADVSDPEAVQAMFKQVEDQWGGIDILINNAGIDGPRAMSWDADFTKWRKVIEVNLFGSFLCAQAALKQMIHQKSGVILNLSSVHELIAWSGYSAYASSKAAVGMLTKTLAQEAAPYGVRVLALAPGAVKTPINKNVWSDEEGLRDLLQKIPLNRVGNVDEVAKMAAVLVSDVASYVTGTTVYVDGGMTDYADFAQGG